MAMAKSYTAWSTYKKCPAQYKHRYVERLPMPSSAAAQRGTNMHAVVEKLVQHEDIPIPEEFSNLEGYSDFFHMLGDKGAIAELGFRLDENWEPTEDKEKTYVRGYIDIIVPPIEGTIYIYELKSGKKYPDHVEQRNFYGTASLCLPWDEEVEQVEVIGVYLDSMQNESNVYPAGMLRTYKYLWDQKMQQMEVPESLVPNPGYYCRWCPYSKDKGGPCKFSGD